MANSNGWGDGAANNSIGWGQGANNNIGWGDSHAKSWAGLTDIVGLTTDADAQAFITAAAITDATQKSAIDTLVKGMKADGIWTKMKAIYPFVGGTATTHKWNLKDPRDLDAAFRLVFNGGWTHSSTGATPNGTNGYADTLLIPSTSLSISSSHLSVYSRTNTPSTAYTGYDIARGNYSLITQYNGNTFFANLENAGLYLASATVSNGLGFYIASRLNNTSVQGFKNSSKLINAVQSSSLATSSLLIGSIGTTNFSSKQYAFASIGDGLTDTEAANLYTRVQAFQTALSRQV